MNWKTTTSGVAFVASLCGFLAGMEPALVAAVPFLAVAQPYLLLISAVAGFTNSYWQKDKDVTGGARRL